MTDEYDIPDINTVDLDGPTVALIRKAAIRRAYAEGRGPRCLPCGACPGH
jgi:hypothetical protein